MKDIEKFPCTDLHTIDQLWVRYSNGRFGFSVQKRIWEEVGGTPEYNYQTGCKFGDRVGWRKNEEWLDYSDLTFTPQAPVGHLPGLFVFLGVRLGWRFWSFRHVFVWCGLVGVVLFSRAKTCNL